MTLLQGHLTPAASRTAAALLSINSAQFPYESDLPAAADWADLIKGGALPHPRALSRRCAVRWNAHFAFLCARASNAQSAAV